MQHISLSQTSVHTYDSSCVIHEYPTTSTTIDGALVRIAGRYPAEGFAMNEVSHELVYVIRGKGSVLTEDGSQTLQEGDEVLIPPGEYFAWDGDLTLFISCVPKFDPVQYKRNSRGGV